MGGKCVRGKGNMLTGWGRIEGGGKDIGECRWEQGETVFRR
jgi:hypothetical protein